MPPDALANVSDDELDEIEERLLSGADRHSSTKLKQRARRLIARHDPDGVRKRRERAEEDRDVRTRAADDGMSTLEGLLPTAGAQRLSMRLREMSLQVCADDPRTLAQRRADALMALTNGADHLPCQCGQEHCPAERTRAMSKGTSAQPPQPKATILVGISATTLLGLDDLPGYLYGYGAIDATLARDIAADGTWKQVLLLSDKDRQRLIETLLDELRATSPELFTDATEAASDTTARDTGGHNTTRNTGTGTGTASKPGTDPDTDIPWVSGRRISTDAHGPILGVGKALKAAGITPSNIRNRTKHSREALTYKPSARLAEIIRTRDGACRFPNCTARAQDCDLDHTVPFNHTNPTLGGLTIEQNLACLCRKHHRLKTEGYWSVKQIGSGRLEWTDPNGTTTVTEPSGPFTDPNNHPDDDHPGHDPDHSGTHGDECRDADSTEGHDSHDSHDSHDDRSTRSRGGGDRETDTVNGTDPANERTLRDLADRNRGCGVEDDLAYLLDTLLPPDKRHPKPRKPAGPILIIDLDEPPPF